MSIAMSVFSAVVALVILLAVIYLSRRGIEESQEGFLDKSRKESLDHIFAYNGLRLVTKPATGCLHTHTRFDPIPWPTGEAIEICNACGSSRSHWEQGVSSWEYIPDIEAARKELQEFMDVNIYYEARAAENRRMRDRAGAHNPQSKFWKIAEDLEQSEWEASHHTLPPKLKAEDN